MEHAHPRGDLVGWYVLGLIGIGWFVHLASMWMREVYRYYKWEWWS